MKTPEQQELGFNLQRLRFMKAVLTKAEIQEAVHGLEDVSLDTVNYLIE